MHERTKRFNKTLTKWATQEEAASALGISTRAVRQFKSGENVPPEPTVRLAELLEGTRKCNDQNTQ